MAASDGEFRIVIPYKPTLSHMSLTKVAIGLYKEFSVQTLRNVFSEMESKSLPVFKKCNSENCPILHNVVKEKLLLIPKNMRKDVLEAVERVQNEVSLWRFDHSSICGLDDAKFTFFWRSDGTVDRVKTAQELVVNQNIDIRNRFDLACMYCLVNSIQTLWKELKAYGDIEKYETSFNASNIFGLSGCEKESMFLGLSLLASTPNLIGFYILWDLYQDSVPFSVS
ncbi:hypothetical protein AVEN_239653-1 [Araneus ventricosus]|uniref:Uncharacterized protein n=1 Tax=Araneus ventricosus TaxID=182803 RepID=A0A4Y2CUJ7_ARAVE|nr:hypothetical protein AVEN_239653-1 [Araneus ventricosus]